MTGRYYPEQAGELSERKQMADEMIELFRQHKSSTDNVKRRQIERKIKDVASRSGVTSVRLTDEKPLTPEELQQLKDSLKAKLKDK